MVKKEVNLAAKYKLFSSGLWGGKQNTEHPQSEMKTWQINATVAWRKSGSSMYISSTSTWNTIAPKVPSNDNFFTLLSTRIQKRMSCRVFIQLFQWQLLLKAICFLVVCPYSWMQCFWDILIFKIFFRLNLLEYDFRFHRFGDCTLQTDSR